MGNCIICGTPVDGEICESHEEDVLFVFRGDSPEQLKPGRFYRGSVDGFAEFGVFVDVGDTVTGLLHRSELDRRLESLDWEPGDTVYVQVLDVRDNGNVDLGWSIRQAEREFRGTLVHEPGGDKRIDDASGADSPATGAEPSSGDTSPTPSSEGTASGGESSDERRGSSDQSDGEVRPSAADAVTGGGGGAVTAVEASESDDEPALNRTTVDALRDQVGSVVRLEGVIVGARQTSGPTVFELRDETGAVECAAFEEAGVRAYPSVDVDDVVVLEGEVELRHDAIQVETERLVVLEDEDREDVETRLTEAIEREARPEEVDLLAEDDAVEAILPSIVDAATAIRKAVAEARPIVVRHRATADGYVAGAAIERAVVPLVREKHTRADAEYHYVQRRPFEGPSYDMDVATNDVTSMLETRDRHGEQLPLVVLVDAGSTLESSDGYDLLSIYGAETLVVDSRYPDPAIADLVDVVVNPWLEADGGAVTTTVLAANVAAHVNPDVRDDLHHLPAVSYWEDVPESYESIATDAGYDLDQTTRLREAIALEAYYQSYKDKRELVSDVLFSGVNSLAAHVSDQFRTKLDAELQTARENREIHTVGGVTLAVLDTDAFTHRFDFPPAALLLSALHREERAAHDEPFVTVGAGGDELHLRSTDAIDVRAIGERVREQVPESGVSVDGGRDGHLTFLTGEREAVLEATLDAVAAELDA